jgi:hypothetical protein
MEGALGGKIKTDKLKLSDFIDETFFEEIEEAMDYEQDDNRTPRSSKETVLNLIRELKSMPENNVLISDVFKTTKRLKTSM